MQCKDCGKSCFSVDPDIECFVLDNHGYIIVSKYIEETGRFFGEINGRLMERLVTENVYEEVNITDYQAVCYNHINEGNPANILKTVIFIFRLHQTIHGFTLACILYFAAVCLRFQFAQVHDKDDCLDLYASSYIASQGKYGL